MDLIFNSEGRKRPWQLFGILRLERLGKIYLCFILWRKMDVARALDGGWWSLIRKSYFFGSVVARSNPLNWLRKQLNFEYIYAIFPQRKRNRSNTTRKLPICDWIFEDFLQNIRVSTNIVIEIGPSKFHWSKLAFWLISQNLWWTASPSKIF